jgi:hypothetical protein
VKWPPVCEDVSPGAGERLVVKTQQIEELNHSAFVREFSVQLWSVHQWTTEAEKWPTRKSEPSQSRRREDTRSPVRNGASLRQPWILSCYN